MDANWLAQAEGHITAFSSLGAFGGIFVWLVRERDVYKRVKLYVNEMYFNYCGERQKLYVPVENGAEAIIPPIPRTFSQQQEYNRPTSPSGVNPNS